MFTRVSLCAIVLAGVASGGYALLPEGRAALGDAPKLLAWMRRIDRCRREQATLLERDRAVYGRIDARRRVVAEVMEQRLSLVEAAARFRELDGEEPNHLVKLRERNPGVSDEECFCREVIAWTAGEWCERPEAERECLVAPLRAELEEQRQGGGVRLPE